MNEALPFHPPPADPVIPPDFLRKAVEAKPKRHGHAYWCKVLELAKTMLNANLAATPEDAFWMARHRIDKEEEK